MKNIFLIRHGESEANADYRTLLEKPDCSINLTEKGLKQADTSSSLFFDYIKENYSEYKLDIEVVVSSYNRAKQTSKPFIEKLKELKNLKSFIVKNSDSLVEINFGLYSGLDPKKEYKENFPKHYKRWEIENKFDNAYFFSPKPSGESYWDLSNRISLDVFKIKESIKISKSNKFIKIVIVIAHGGTNRCFAKVALEKDVEWFTSLKNPNNCEVWALDKNKLYTNILKV